MNDSVEKIKLSKEFAEVTAMLRAAPANMLAVKIAEYAEAGFSVKESIDRAWSEVIAF